jgi:peroxiredoxin Q/BCP
MLNAGDAAPDFTLKDSKGQSVSLKDFQGKTLVMWFFPKADTPG